MQQLLCVSLLACINPATKRSTPKGIGLFDGDGNRIEFSHPTNKDDIIGDGNKMDIVIPSFDTDNTKPAEYISISQDGGQDPICVAYAAVSCADGFSDGSGGTQWKFFGDVAQACGAAWYHSNLIVPTDSNNEFKPKCVWIGESGGYPQGMAIHMPDFDLGSTAKTQQRIVDYQNNPDTMCKSTPRWKMWENLSKFNFIPVFDPPLAYSPDGSDPENIEPVFQGGVAMGTPGPLDEVTSEQRSSLLMEYYPDAAPGPTWFPSVVGTSYRRRKLRRSVIDDHVVVSTAKMQSARELCESETSSGPDFVSTVEGLHCDMEHRRLRSVCNTTVVHECFDMESNSVRRASGLIARNDDGVARMEKSYRRRLDWS